MTDGLMTPRRHGDGDRDLRDSGMSDSSLTPRADLRRMDGLRQIGVQVEGRRTKEVFHDLCNRIAELEESTSKAQEQVPTISLSEKRQRGRRVGRGGAGSRMSNDDGEGSSMSRSPEPLRCGSDDSDEDGEDGDLTFHSATLLSSGVPYSHSGSRPQSPSPSSTPNSAHTPRFSFAAATRVVPGLVVDGKATREVYDELCNTLQELQEKQNSQVAQVPMAHERKASNAQMVCASRGTGSDGYSSCDELLDESIQSMEADERRRDQEERQRDQLSTLPQRHSEASDLPSRRAVLRHEEEDQRREVEEGEDSIDGDEFTRECRTMTPRRGTTIPLSMSMDSLQMAHESNRMARDSGHRLPKSRSGASTPRVAKTPRPRSGHDRHGIAEDNMDGQDDELQQHQAAPRPKMPRPRSSIGRPDWDKPDSARGAHDYGDERGQAGDTQHEEKSSDDGHATSRSEIDMAPAAPPIRPRSAMRTPRPKSARHLDGDVLSSAGALSDQLRLGLRFEAVDKDEVRPGSQTARSHVSHRTINVADTQDGSHTERSSATERSPTGEIDMVSKFPRPRSACQETRSEGGQARMRDVYEGNEGSQDREEALGRSDEGRGSPARLGSSHAEPSEEDSEMHEERNEGPEDSYLRDTAEPPSRGEPLEDSMARDERDDSRVEPLDDSRVDPLEDSRVDPLEDSRVDPLEDSMVSQMDSTLDTTMAGRPQSPVAVAVAVAVATPADRDMAGGAAVPVAQCLEDGDEGAGEDGAVAVAVNGPCEHEGGPRGSPMPSGLVTPPSEGITVSPSQDDENQPASVGVAVAVAGSAGINVAPGGKTVEVFVGSGESGDGGECGDQRASRGGAVARRRVREPSPEPVAVPPSTAARGKTRGKAAARGKVAAAVPAPPKVKMECRVLLLGLDNAGKTTMTRMIADESIEGIAPTTAYTNKVVTIGGVRLNLWDVAGQEAKRKYWPDYFDGTDAIIYVIDSADPRRVDESLDHLHNTLESEELNNLPLLVLSNKQDLPLAAPVDELSDQLLLYALRGREWNMVGCSARTGDGLLEAFQWLADTLCGASNDRSGLAQYEEDW